MDDYKIVRQVSGFRAVAPGVNRSGHTVYLNNSRLIVEKNIKDALGNDAWIEIGAIDYPLSTKGTDYDSAIYSLLVGDLLNRQKI